MICPNCGVENKDDANFCKNCAASLKKENLKEISDNSKFDELKSDSDDTNRIKKDMASKNISNINNVDSGSIQKKSKNNNTLIICLTVIICVAVIAGALIYLNPDILSNSGNTQVNETTSQASNSGSVGSSDSAKSVSIQFSDFFTGTSASDKTYCSANIGAHHYGEKYQISVLYSRDGSNLNDGSLVKKTVDDEGFLHVSSSNAFSHYPDKAIVTIYDMNENVLDEKTYYLDPVSGQQSYNN